MCYAETVAALEWQSGKDSFTLESLLLRTVCGKSAEGVRSYRDQSLRQKDRASKVHVLLFRGADENQLFFVSKILRRKKKWKRY